VTVSISIIWLDYTGIAGLKVFATGRLDLDNRFVGARSALSAIYTVCVWVVHGRLP
jgi:hypothetical protein